VIDSLETRLTRLGTRLDRDGSVLEHSVVRSLDEPGVRAPSVALLRARRAPRASRRRLAVAAALVMALVAATAGWILIHRSNEPSPKISTPATTPDRTTRAGSACPSFRGASTKPRSGHSKQSAMIRDIDFQTSQCGTTLYFTAGAGKWSLHYASDGSKTLIARLDGAHAFVGNGSGYLQDTYTPDALSVIRELTRIRHRNDGQDPGTTWSIRLDQRRPFTAGTTTIGGTRVFAINVVAWSGALRCRLHPHIEVTIPEGWYVDTTDGCALWGPEPIARKTAVGSNAAVQLIAGSDFGDRGIQLVDGPLGESSRVDLGTVTINERQATRTLFSDAPSASDVYQEYQVVIRWNPATTVVVAGLTRPFPAASPTRAPISLTDLQGIVDTIASSATSVR
jgi:hypothetical protein